MPEELCPLCGVGTPTNCVEVESIIRNGQVCLVKTHFRTCSHCTSDFYGLKESELNKLEMEQVYAATRKPG